MWEKVPLFASAMAWYSATPSFEPEIRIVSSGILCQFATVISATDAGVSEQPSHIDGPSPTRITRLCSRSLRPAIASAAIAAGMTHVKPLAERLNKKPLAVTLLPGFAGSGVGAQVLTLPLNATMLK